MSIKADPKLMRTLNETKILNLIRDKGPISRNELAKSSKISKVAVSSIIKKLDAQDFILETGKGLSTRKGGRRPALLKLNPRKGYVIGIQIKRGNVTIALADIEAKIYGIKLLRYDIKASIDDTIGEIFSRIDALIAEIGIKKDRLVSIGIGLPGLIDYSKGQLNYAISLKEWIHQPLAARFSEHYDVPTILEKDVNTITLSESLIGAGRGIANVVCVLIESGIGVGILVNGQLIRGETGSTGEIGFLELGNHMIKSERTRHIRTDQRHFGEILSDVNLSDALKRKLRADSNLSTEDISRMALTEILALGDNGSREVREVLDEYALPLSIICKNIISLINPTKLILSGQIIENSQYLFKKVKQLVEGDMANTPFLPRNSDSIVIAELRERAGVKGAIILALQTIFVPSLISQEDYVA